MIVCMVAVTLPQVLRKSARHGISKWRSNSVPVLILSHALHAVAASVVRRRLGSPDTVLHAVIIAVTQVDSDTMMPHHALACIQCIAYLLCFWIHVVSFNMLSFACFVVCSTFVSASLFSRCLQVSTLLASAVLFSRLPLSGLCGAAFFPVLLFAFHFILGNGRGTSLAGRSSLSGRITQPPAGGRVSHFVVFLSNSFTFLRLHLSLTCGRWSGSVPDVAFRQ